MKIKTVAVNSAAKTLGKFECAEVKTTMLPEIGFLRLSQILGNPKANPPIPPIFPLSKSAWWEAVKAGLIPKPVKLFGKNISAWSVETIRTLVKQLNEKK